MSKGYSVVVLLLIFLSGCAGAPSKEDSVQLTIAKLSWRQPDKAIELFDNTLKEYKNWDRGGVRTYVDFEMVSLCHAYYELRIYDKARSCLSFYETNHVPNIETWLSQKKSKEIPQMVTFYAEMSSLLLDIGNYSDAYQYSTKGIDYLVVDGGGEHQVFNDGTALEGKKTLYAIKSISAHSLGKYNESQYYADSIGEVYIQAPFWKSQGRSEHLQTRNSLQAKAYLVSGQYEKAESALNKSSTDLGAIIGRTIMIGMSYGLSEVLSDTNTIADPYQVDVIYMKAKVCLALGKYDCAKEHYDALVRGYRDYRDYLFGGGDGDANRDINLRRGLLSLVKHERGLIYLHEGDKDNALKSFKEAVDIIESQRSTLVTEASKIGFVGDKLAVYRDIVGLLIDMGQYDEAFEFVERGKARSLVDMLASKEHFYKNDESQLVAMLFSDNDGSIDPSGKTASLPATETGGQRSADRGIRLKRRKEMVDTQPEMASLVTVSSPKVHELQKMLARNDTLIEYYGDSEKLYAFVMINDGISAVQLNVTGIDNSVSAFREALMTPGSDNYRNSGATLYQQLVAPLANHIKTSNVTFVPHGVLHYLPFNALPVGRGHLIDKYKIRVLPSASVMQFLNKPHKARGTLLALGNPDLQDISLDLPGAQKEAIAISKKLPNAHLLLRAKATETAVKAHGGAYQYLHFASHGVFDPEKPLQSGLLLSKDAANDGMLTVGELYDLNLNADLVTLSACETALGKVANGDDVVGFTRGFLYAGANSIVSSLWKVDDVATSQLMQGFYSNMTKEDKRSALRDAQLSVKNKYSHPYYWAAFQLTGSVN